MASDIEQIFSRARHALLQVLEVMFQASPTQADAVATEVDRLLDDLRFSISTNLATMSQDSPARLQSNISNLIEVLQHSAISSGNMAPSNAGMFIPGLETSSPRQTDLDSGFFSLGSSSWRPAAVLRPANSSFFPTLGEQNAKSAAATTDDDDDDDGGGGSGESDDGDDYDENDNNVILESQGGHNSSENDEQADGEGEEEEQEEEHDDNDEDDDDDDDDDNDDDDDELNVPHNVGEPHHGFILALAGSIGRHGCLEELRNVWEMETPPTSRHRDQRDVAQAMRTIDESERALVGNVINRRWALRDLVARREEIIAGESLTPIPNRYNRRNARALDELMRLGFPHLKRGKTIRGSSKEWQSRHRQLKSRLRAGWTWYALDEAFGLGTFALVPAGLFASFSTSRIERMPRSELAALIDNLRERQGEIVHLSAEAARIINATGADHDGA